MDNSMARKLISKIRQLNSACMGARCVTCIEYKSGVMWSGDELFYCNKGIDIDFRFSDTKRCDFGCNLFKPLDTDRLDDSGFVKDDIKF